MPIQWEEAGWTVEQYEQLQAEAEASFRRSAVLRQVIPVGPAPPDRYNVVDLGLNVAAGSLEVTPNNVPPIRLMCNFVIRSEQMGDEALVARVVRQAAHRLGMLETMMIAYGLGPAPAVPALAFVGAAAGGALSAAQLRQRMYHAAMRAVMGGAFRPPAYVKPVKGVVQFLPTLFDALTQLQAQGHAGPYALIMTPAEIQNYSMALGTSPQRNAVRDLLGPDHRIVAIPGVALPTIADHDQAPGGKLAAADRPTGFLMSLSAEALEVAEATPLSISKVQEVGGDLFLRIEERMLLRVNDASAICAFHT